MPRHSDKPQAQPAQPLEPEDVGRVSESVAKLLADSRIRWLATNSIKRILEEARSLGLPISKSPAYQPSGGSMFLYDKRQTKNFRKDEHDWTKKNDGKGIAETHEKLKVDNKDVINCYYARPTDPAIYPHRRSYWLLGSDDQLVLVHYIMVKAGERGPNKRMISETMQSSSEQESNEEYSQIKTRARAKHLQSTQVAESDEDVAKPTEWSEADSAVTQTSQNDAAEKRGGGEASLPTPAPHSDEESAPLAQCMSLGEMPSLSLSFLQHTCSIQGPNTEAGGLSSNELPLQELHDLYAEDSLQEFGGFPKEDFMMRVVNNSTPEPSPLTTNWTLRRGINPARTFGPPLNSPPRGQQLRDIFSDLPMRDSGGSHVGEINLANHAEPLGHRTQMPSNLEWQPEFDGSQSGTYSRNNIPPNIQKLAEGLESGPMYAQPRHLHSQEHSQGMGPSTPHASWHPELLGRRSGTSSVQRGTPSFQTASDYTEMHPRAPQTNRSCMPSPFLAAANQNPLRSFGQGSERLRPGMQSQPVPHPWQELGHHDLPHRSTSTNLPPLAIHEPFPGQYAGQSEAHGMFSDVFRDVGGSKAQRAMSGSLYAFDGTGHSQRQRVPRFRASQALSLERSLTDLDEQLNHMETPNPEIPHTVVARLHRRASELVARASDLSTSCRREPPLQMHGSMNLDTPQAGEELERQFSGRSALDHSMTTMDTEAMRRGQQYPFRLIMCAPDWDFPAGGAQIMLACNFDYPQIYQMRDPCVYISFDGQELVATSVRPGVFRVLAPPHPPGSVKLFITLGDSIPQSNTLDFTFREFPSLDSPKASLLAMSDWEAQLEILKMLKAGGYSRAPSRMSPSNQGSAETPSGGAQQRSTGQSEGGKTEFSGSGTESHFEMDEQSVRAIIEDAIQEQAAQADRFAQEDHNSQDQGASQKPSRDVHRGMLHFAALLGMERAMESLIASGHRLDDAGPGGCTALHLAAAKGNMKCIATLVAHRADCQLQNSTGYLSADIAAENGFLGIAAFLAEWYLEQATCSVFGDNDSSPALSAPGSPKRKIKRTEDPDLASGNSSGDMFRPSIQYDITAFSNLDSSTAPWSAGLVDAEAIVSRAVGRARKLDIAKARKEEKLSHMQGKQTMMEERCNEAEERMRQREDKYWEKFEGSKLGKRRISNDYLELGSSICTIQEKLKEVIRLDRPRLTGLDKAMPLSSTAISVATARGIDDPRSVETTSQFSGPPHPKSKDSMIGHHARGGSPSLHCQALGLIQEMVKSPPALREYAAMQQEFYSKVRKAQTRSGFKFACYGTHSWE